MTRPDPVSRSAVEALVVNAVSDMLRDQERSFSGSITPDTRLVADLDCQSLDVVMLLGFLNRELQLVEVPFEELFYAGGRPVNDLSLRRVMDFLWSQSRRSASGETAGSAPVPRSG